MRININTGNVSGLIPYEYDLLLRLVREYEAHEGQNELKQK